MIERNSAVIYRFDTERYPFKQIVDDHFKKHLKIGSEDLHTLGDASYFPEGIVVPGSDNNTPLHDILYTVFNGEQFLPVFREFAKSLQEYVGEELIFQKKPTFRIHLPGNLSVGNYHRDSDYGHPIEEVNVWLPMTRARNTATIWIESEYDKEDFRPFEMDYGQFLIFDSQLKHGNEINTENYTRVSMDFRVIPKSQYKDTDKITGNRGHKLSLGNYYDQF